MDNSLGRRTGVLALIAAAPGFLTSGSTRHCHNCHNSARVPSLALWHPASPDLLALWHSGTVLPLILAPQRLAFLYVECHLAHCSGLTLYFDNHDQDAQQRWLLPRFSILLRIATFFRKESCGQCVPCRVGAIRQQEAIERLIEGRPLNSAAEEIVTLREMGQAMRDASICGHGHDHSANLPHHGGRFEASRRHSRRARLASATSRQGNGKGCRQHRSALQPAVRTCGRRLGGESDGIL